MVSSTRRALFSATLFLAACGLTGSVVGGRVAAQSATDESSLRDSMKSFTDVYSLVEQNYADKLNTDQVDKSIYDGAIPGMLHVLDPHSNFYDPKAYAQMREDQHGKYYGVGMQIQPEGNKIVVLAPFEGTPSYKAGIRPGDQIVSVDGKVIENMDTAAVATLLKGPRGTHVSVTMSREGTPKPLVFDLVRDEIPRYSVDISFMIKPGVGYIHITNEMETTSREVQEALDKFGPNMQGLLIDLRSNPGGLLNEAVNVCDKFLQKGPDRGLAAGTGVSRPGVPCAQRLGRQVPYRDFGERQHSLRGGDHLRRAARPRPRADRRRDDLRQGTGADRVPDQ